MRPLYRLQAAGRDITEAIHDRLLELIIIDEAGLHADELRLTLDDRRREGGAVAELPDIGTVLSVSLGYAETSLVPMGTYIVDEVELRAPPATLTVSAKAANMPQAFRCQRTESWHDTTLGEIVGTIAKRHGLDPKIDGDLAGIPIPHIDQTGESDMAFVTRLARQHDAIAKPVDGMLVFARRGVAKTITGQAMPTMRVNPSDLTEWRYHHSARNPGGHGDIGDVGQASAIGGVRAYWWDFDKGERQVVTVGSPPFEDLRYVYSSAQDAHAAAASRKNHGDRHQSELSLRMPGHPLLAAAQKLVVHLRPGIPTTWRIKRAEHRLSAQGYTTTLECELDVEAPVPVIG